MTKSVSAIRSLAPARTVSTTSRGSSSDSLGEIKSIVLAVLAEQREGALAIPDETMVKTVVAILTSFGIYDDDCKEMRADFQHLRRWRKSVEQVQSYTFKVVITLIVTGFVGAVWLGIKATLGK
ncbi:MULTISPECIES: hypothetical protein [Bradyrhizobium]|jgi:hypothetical protein|uniref:Transmembrane protein n=2 Tax=Bradyrhizobium TaxID=374 RepID=A0ABY0Q821_9BRAD|nr:hypothetical protein [Bradyrhizobium lablabi]SDJ66455.1 hypothetical protein SAMN05444163_6088 [Bradyrhizobium ottawaense]SEC29084.1 hypothetical protein SAMN05444171_1071 [Bradyrhizobium lablabi]SHM84234.1 hypothetical protein SAMN05444321_7857 [Bradyrhizobium lablabi]